MQDQEDDVFVEACTTKTTRPMKTTKSMKTTRTTYKIAIDEERGGFEPERLRNRRPVTTVGVEPTPLARPAPKAGALEEAY